MNGKISRLEANLTKAYKGLLAKGGGTIHVDGNSKDGVAAADVKASRWARALQDAKFNASDRRSFVTDEYGNRREQSANADRNTGLINFFKPVVSAPGGLQGDWRQQGNGIHEGLHFVPQMTRWDNWPSDHQDPFRRAVESVIGPSP